MKSFLASCLILFLLTAAAATNHFYLEKTTDELYACAAALPELLTENDNGIRAYMDELERIWTENRRLFSLSVPASRMERIERSIAAAAAAARCGNADSYTSSRTELMIYLAQLREAELLSLQGIL